MKFVAKLTLAAALGASALATTATPALARPYYYGGGYHRYHGGDIAGAAIGAGILGLAIGAIAASSAHHDDRYYDRDYQVRYAEPRPYADGFYFRDGYYWDRDGRRYDRYEYDRYQRDYDYRSGYDRDPGYYRRGY